MHDPMSHQRVPPAQPAPPPPPTQEEIMEKISRLEGFGSISEYMFDNVDDQLDMLRVLLRADAELRVLKHIVEQSTDDEEKISSKIDILVNSFDSFFDSESNVREIFSRMKNSLTNGTRSRRIKAFDGFIERFALPEGIEEILRAFDSQTASYANALSSNPLDIARRNPDGKPDENLIEFLKTIPGLSKNPMFTQMMSSHSSVKKGRSVLTNKALFGFYDSFMAVHELDGIIEEQHAMELAKQDHKRTVQQIVGDINCLKATNLAVSFNIMTAHRGVFCEFVDQLDQSHQAILVSNFSTFMSVYSACMSMSMSKDGSISVESLNGAFKRFLDSFKLDEKSREIDEEFFKFYRKTDFDSLWSLLNVSCPSPDVRSGDGEIKSSDILKRFFKAINGIFGSSVKSMEERNFFESELAKRGLVLLSMVMMSPDKFSKLVSAPFSKTYTEMEKSPFKSFLYWLTQTATEGSRSRSRFNPSTFEWSNLPNFFTCRNSDGDQEFSIHSLFQAIDYTFSGFMSAKDTGLNQVVDVMQFLEYNELDLLFGFQEDPCLIFLNDGQPPDAVKHVLLSCYMVDESSHGARQVSHLKSLLSLPKDQIRTLLKLLIEMPSSEEKEANFDSICELLCLEMSTQTKEIAFSGLSEFLVMLHSLSLDSDLYSQAISMMSIFSYMQKHANKSRYFMSMPSSVIFVLMTKQFPTLTYSEIANMIYKVRYGHDGGTFFVHQQSVDTMLAKLDERSSIKEQLRYFAIRSQTKKEKEERNTDQTRKVEIKECEGLIRRFKMLFEEHCPLLHEFLKRALPYFMKPEYASKLFQGCNEHLEFSASSQSPEDALNERLKELFKMFLMQAISQKKTQIFFDLSKTFGEIEKTCSVENKNLAFYKFARHVSAWINLLNSLFENIGIQHRLSFDKIMRNFPDTKSKTSTPLEKATLMTHHVCSILNIPVPENTDDFVQHDQNSVLFWVVFQSLLATYNTELPKNESELPKEAIVRTISILELKTLIERSTTLDQVFFNGLPYMDSNLIRAFQIQILMHHFSSGNKKKLDSLLRSLQTFESKFTQNEKETFCELFAYVEAPLPAPDISNITSSVCKEEELFDQIKESLQADGEWTDADVHVVISQSKVKKVLQPRFKFVKAEDDLGMACGGGAIVAVESEEEEELVDDPTEEPVEDSVKQSFDANHLQELLSSDERLLAIEYLQLVELGEFDEILQAAIEMLKNEENICVDVIDALIQYGVFEED